MLSFCALKSITAFVSVFPQASCNQWLSAEGILMQAVFWEIWLIYRATLVQGLPNKPWQMLRTALSYKIFPTKLLSFPLCFISSPTHIMYDDSSASPVFLTISLTGVAPKYITWIAILIWSLLSGALSNGKPKLEVLFCYYLFGIRKYFLRVNRERCSRIQKMHKLGKIPLSLGKWGRIRSILQRKNEVFIKTLVLRRFMH